MKFFHSTVSPLVAGATIFASVAHCMPACRAAASAGVSNITITSSKIQRSFLLWVSPSYKPNNQASVILSFHGAARNASDQLELDGFTTAHGNPASIVVYPQGLDDYWQGQPNKTTNDVQFTNDILDYVENKYSVDTKRIYASGKSAGGGMCNLLACDANMSKRIAAFAPVSGAFYVDQGSATCNPDTVKLPCNPGRGSIPFLEFHGGNDTTVHYNGGDRKGECLPAIPHFIREWAARNGLGTHNETTHVAKNTESYSFGSGASAGLVRHIFESDIGHDWPSTARNSDNSREGHHVASYNATPIILDFFSNHHLA